MGRIAIVDDNKDALQLFEFMLSDQHEIFTFADGEEFLKEFRHGSFDLVLLDLVMSGMDGFEVFSRIQKIDKDVPVAAITGRAHQEERERALRAGFCDYFVKPIMDIGRFQQTVYSHIGKCANPPYKPSKDAA
jgi:CheY-like chemotaxis protein